MTDDIAVGVVCSSSVGALLRRWGLGRELLGVPGLLDAPPGRDRYDVETSVAVLSLDVEAEYSDPRPLSSDRWGRDGPPGAGFAGGPRGELEMKPLLLGVVGRDGGRAICKGRVPLALVAGGGAELFPFVREGERTRRLGKGGALDIRRSTSNREVFQIGTIHAWSCRYRRSSPPS